ncbi:MAG: hypothetical protein V1647_03325 [Pseudomonadota bacterium]
MITELVNTLLRAGIIKDEEVQRARAYEFGTSLVERLLVLGHGSEDDVYKIIKNKLKLAVAEQKDFSDISPETLSSIPRDLIDKNHILPFNADETSIHVAMFDPTNDTCISELNFFTSKRIIPYGAFSSILSKSINRYFNLGLPEAFKFVRSEVTPKTEQKPVEAQTVPNIPRPQNLSKEPKIEPKPEPSSTPAASASKTSKDVIINDILDKMKLVSKRSIILFRKYSDMIFETGFGDGITDELKGYTIPLNAPSIFMGAFERKSYFHGMAAKNYLTDEFFKVLGGTRPKIVSVIPVTIDDEVFAMIYAEEVRDITMATHIAEGMAHAFEKLLES